MINFFMILLKLNTLTREHACTLRVTSPYRPAASLKLIRDSANFGLKWMLYFNRYQGKVIGKSVLWKICVHFVRERKR